MKALILAAGIGSRLKYKTKNKPKALVKVNNREILGHQLSILEKFKIKNVGIVVGYKSDKIINFIKKKTYFKFEIIFNKKYNTTDSAYSYKLAKKFLNNSSYIHLNCDILFNENVFKKILNSKKKNILSCRSDLKLGEKMDLIKSVKSKITKFDNKFYVGAEKKVFGLAKISTSLSKKMLLNIESDIRKKKLKQKCFSYFKELCKKSSIHSIEFNKYQLKEINYLDDIKD